MTSSLLNKKNIFIAACLILILAVIFYLLGTYGVLSRLSDAVSKHTNPYLFILLMLVLPVCFFPISPFLVIGGIKFGLVGGIVLMFVTMPVHLLISHYLSRTFFRSWLERLATKRNVDIPEIPKEKTLWVSIVFMAIPGLTYSMKNYLLALSKVPFRHFFLAGWLVQAAMGIPFVVIGESARDESFLLFVVFLVLLTIGYLLTAWVKKRYGVRAKGKAE